MSDGSLIDGLAARVAERVDRRHFMRRVAKATFSAVALTAAGGTISVLRAAPAYAYASACEGATDGVGAGCPSGGHYGKPCGPSRCCGYLNGRPSGCHSGSNRGCPSGTTPCPGKAGTWSGQSCWTCTGPVYPCDGTGCVCAYITTCCDCSTSGCSDSSGRCISHCTTIRKLGCFSEHEYKRLLSKQAV